MTVSSVLDATILVPRAVPRAVLGLVLDERGSLKTLTRLRTCALGCVTVLAVSERGLSATSRACDADVIVVARLDSALEKGPGVASCALPAAFDASASSPYGSVGAAVNIREVLAYPTASHIVR